VLIVVLLVAAAVIAYVVWTMRAPVNPREPLGAHAMFDGGERYSTAEERMRIETEGVLLALVDALRGRGVTTNPVEPETYGFMTVISIEGEDIILELSAGGDQTWILFVKAPSEKVPVEVMDALRSLDDVRNIKWQL
jgi:hypothetical protein